MNKKQFLMYYRIGFGALALIALITEIVVLVNQGNFMPSNFFSYFTVEANLFAACVLLFLGLRTTKASSHSKKIQLIRGAATLYMIMTGVIFAILLANIEGATLTAVPWDNVALHYIMPIVLLIDWLIDPPKVKLSLRNAWLWLIAPIVYIIYSLIRGEITNWYPYPFLNPSVNGLPTMIVTLVALTGFVVFASWTLCRTTRSAK